MKIATPEEIHAHAAASRRGAIEGGVASGIVALGGSYYLHRKFPGYRQLPLSLKALGLVIVVAPILSIQAERRGLEYDKSQWKGEGVRILHGKQVAADERWEDMSTQDKIADWSNRHQYSIILGGWASSLAFAGAVISRDKYQTTAQKVVQARMWAQGLTIGILIVAGALTQAQRAKSAKHVNTDHSWRDILEQQDRDREEAARLKEEVTPPTRRLGAAA
ncbi:Respiratory supercomplex factor 2, mitochondrial [Hypsizygus marmoreus]|uniref:Respiratory supercomplex factor 2, mitochondrial n=1 Tax=Hypsizygus marmoreus TaxID=39966 RepID=A0A369JFP7_HYPMA|nr:Respiratory supercomplex factor 2, mitochondrial [Hypsizygus marmoreus]